MKTAVQLLLPEMDGTAGFYEARTDRVLCVRCAGRPTPAGTPIPEPDCGDLHCSRCRQPLRRVKRRDDPRRGGGTVRVAQQRRAGWRGAERLPRQAALAPEVVDRRLHLAGVPCVPVVAG